ncbi:14014_t:CDS:1, partial [Dentiscutata heterogama]
MPKEFLQLLDEFKFGEFKKKKTVHYELFRYPQYVDYIEWLCDKNDICVPVDLYSQCHYWDDEKYNNKKLYQSIAKIPYTNHFKYLSLFSSRVWPEYAKQNGFMYCPDELLGLVSNCCASKFLGISSDEICGSTLWMHYAKFELLWLEQTAKIVRDNQELLKSLNYNQEAYSKKKQSFNYYKITKKVYCSDNLVLWHIEKNPYKIACNIVPKGVTKDSLMAYSLFFITGTQGDVGPVEPFIEQLEDEKEQFSIVIHDDLKIKANVNIIRTGVTSSEFLEAFKKSTTDVLP